MFRGGHDDLGRMLPALELFCPMGRYVPNGTVCFGICGPLADAKVGQLVCFKCAKLLAAAGKGKCGDDALEQRSLCWLGHGGLGGAEGD